MPWPYLRNVAQEFDFPLFDASGNLVNESGTITKQVVIDGQNFVNVSGSVTQYGTSGVYKFSGQAPDWNGARLTFKFTSAIVKPTVLTFHTDSKRFSDIPSLADLKAQAENAMTAYGALKTSVSGRLLDVSAGGEAGLDWANIGSPTTAQNLSATTISGVNSMAPPGPTSQDIWSFATRTITNKTGFSIAGRSEEHTSELQSRLHLVCRLLLEKKKKNKRTQSENDISQGALSGVRQDARAHSLSVATRSLSASADPLSCFFFFFF